MIKKLTFGVLALTIAASSASAFNANYHARVNDWTKEVKSMRGFDLYNILHADVIPYVDITSEFGRSAAIVEKCLVENHMTGGEYTNADYSYAHTETKKLVNSWVDDLRDTMLSQNIMVRVFAKNKYIDPVKNRVSDKVESICHDK